MKEEITVSLEEFLKCVLHGKDYDSLRDMFDLTAITPVDFLSLDDELQYILEYHTYENRHQIECVLNHILEDLYK